MSQIQSDASAATGEKTVAPPPALRDQQALAQPASPSASPRGPGRNGRLRRVVLPVLILAALGYGGARGWDWFVSGRFIVSTDDAYVRADTAVIAAKVAGHVATVHVRENQQVRAGDLLVTLDDGDYRLAVSAAGERIATQDAAIARIAEQVRAQEATIEQARAQLAAAEAEETRAQSAFARAETLARNDYASRAQFETARAERDRALATERAAQAQVAAAQGATSVLQAQADEARRLRAELMTAKEKAERDLSFTRIVAPFDGVTGNRAAQTGQFVQPGTRLLALVPLDRVYVDANFKETQLARIAPGQKVGIEVDALGGRVIEGVVESLAPASGAQFSLLPPDNATGNFTKIVQRVPVRIAIPGEIAREGLLRPGYSVVAHVRTRDEKAPRPSLMGALGLARDP